MITLGQLRKLLAMSDEYVCVPYGFKEPHSWRGIYSEVAFEPASNVSVADMRRDVDRALKEAFEAYKGGLYTFYEHTPVHLDMWGDCNDWDISPVITSIALAIAEAMADA